jgi:hypothetical protein
VHFSQFLIKEIVAVIPHHLIIPLVVAAVRVLVGPTVHQQLAVRAATAQLGMMALLMLAAAVVQFRLTGPELVGLVVLVVVALGPTIVLAKERTVLQTLAGAAAVAPVLTMRQKHLQMGVLAL